jgi:hypothetical protein
MSTKSKATGVVLGADMPAVQHLRVSRGPPQPRQTVNTCETDVPRPDRPPEAIDKVHVLKPNANCGNEDLEGVEWLISEIDKTLKGFQNDGREIRENKERNKQVIELGKKF